MDTEPNIDAIEIEFQAARDELKDILLDIRVFLMEAQTPIPNDMEKERLREELESQRG